MNPEADSTTCQSSSTEPAVCACGTAWRSGRPALSAIVLLLVFGALWSWHTGSSDAQSASPGGGPSSGAHFDHDHSAWTAVLQRYVQSCFVDYAGLKKNGQAKLDTYLRSLESVRRSHYDSWTREQQLAYWINAYNAYMVQLILNHYPLKSIRSIGLLPGAAFRDDFIPLKGVLGKTLSLNNIEHEILRKQFQEPRIHFAIVCASKSCPILRPEAYRAKDLHSQLDDAARAFIRDSSKNSFEPGARTLRLSSIFKWFREDFEREARTLPDLWRGTPTSRPRGRSVATTSAWNSLITTGP